MLKRLITPAILVSSLALPAVAVVIGASTAASVQVLADGPEGDNTHWGSDDPTGV